MALFGAAFGAFASPGSSKAKSSPKQGMLLLEVKARKLRASSFPSLCGQTVFSFFLVSSPSEQRRTSPPPELAPTPPTASKSISDHRFCSPQVLPRPEFHCATISGTGAVAAAWGRWGRAPLGGDARDRQG
jgi:hypothetical protein